MTLIAHSPQMIKLRLEILEIAKMTRCVLVSGGSGTGKELVARKIHEKSERAACKFAAINCGAINIAAYREYSLWSCERRIYRCCD